MLEGQLETAICRAFPLLLPDLYGAGYRIRSSQAILLGRRIDLLLETPAGLASLVELKAGSPPMPHVRDQILDYAECWRRSFPDQRLRLLVIANDIPERTKAELSNFGVESRTISVASVLAALETQLAGDHATVGLKLIPADVAKVKHLLSEYSTVVMPEGLVLGPPWSHEKVFLALVERGEKHKELWMKNIYVQLYPQRPNCAVLYGPRVKAAQRGPLHLNSRVDSWREEIFEKIRPSVEFARSDNKSPGRERGNFDWYRISDWDGLATALGL
jgi:hypothetical protein